LKKLKMKSSSVLREVGQPKEYELKEEKDKIVYFLCGKVFMFAFGIFCIR